MNNEIYEQLCKLEHTGGRFGFAKNSAIINGKKVRAESRPNNGRSGKGTTTIWYVDGVRVARAKLPELLA